MDKSATIWDVRTFIYHHFAHNASAPTVDEVAGAFQFEAAAAIQILRELGDRHAILFDADQARIRMANPFSGVPTSFRVRAQGRDYFANCAWDAFGIAVALESDVEIDARCAQSHAPLQLGVKDGRPVHHNEQVQFLLPFRRWYDDLTHT